MHETRIAALVERLSILDEKEASGRYPVDFIADDRAATEFELEALRGLAARNDDLAAQAPGMAWDDAARAYRINRFRETMQIASRSKVATRAAAAFDAEVARRQAEASAVVAIADAQLARRHRQRERLQLTPGSSIPA